MFSSKSGIPTKQVIFPVSMGIQGSCRVLWSVSTAVMLRCGLTKRRVGMIFAARDTAHLPQLWCFRQWTESKFLFFLRFLLSVHPGYCKCAWDPGCAWNTPIQCLRHKAELWTQHLHQTNVSLEPRTVVLHTAGRLLQLLPLDVNSRPIAF